MNNWIYIGDKCMEDDFETKQWFSFCTFYLAISQVQSNLLFHYYAPLISPIHYMT